MTTLGVLATAHIAYDAYMPVMLAVMEIPGCLVALFLVARLRNQGMDALGNMPDEPGYDPTRCAARQTTWASPGTMPATKHEQGVESELEMALEKMEHPDFKRQRQTGRKKHVSVFTGKLLHEVFLNTGSLPPVRRDRHRPHQRPAGPRGHPRRRQLLRHAVPGRALPLPARDGHDGLAQAQGPEDGGLAVRGLRPGRPQHLRDARHPGRPRLLPGRPATHFELGTYVLFSVLCGAASYIAVPAVQRLAIPEASPTLPLAASLGLTFSYNVTSASRSTWRSPRLSFEVSRSRDQALPKRFIGFALMSVVARILQRSEAVLEWLACATNPKRQREFRWLSCDIKPCSVLSMTGRLFLSIRPFSSVWNTVSSLGSRHSIWILLRLFLLPVVRRIVRSPLARQGALAEWLRLFQDRSRAADRANRGDIGCPRHRLCHSATLYPTSKPPSRLTGLSLDPRVTINSISCISDLEGLSSTPRSRLGRLEQLCCRDDPPWRCRRDL